MNIHIFYYIYNIQKEYISIQLIYSCKYYEVSEMIMPNEMRVVKEDECVYGEYGETVDKRPPITSISNLARAA